MDLTANVYVHAIVAQAAFNFSAMCGAIAGPPIMGALVNANLHSGWRTYYVSCWFGVPAVFYLTASSGLYLEFGCLHL